MRISVSAWALPGTSDQRGGLQAVGQQGPEQESGGWVWLTLLIAIPAMALCCGGPLLLAAAGAALAVGAAWMRGYGGLALLAAAGVLAAIWWARRGAGAGRDRRSQVAWRKGAAR